MPRVDFCFQGWVRGANVTKATNSKGEDVDVTDMPPEELKQKLEKEELSIALGDYLYGNHADSNIEKHDWEVS